MKLGKMPDEKISRMKYYPGKTNNSNNECDTTVVNT